MKLASNAKGKGTKIFGLKIRAKRREMEYTQKEIAHLIGISRYSVILMEQGEVHS